MARAPGSMLSSRSFDFTLSSESSNTRMSMIVTGLFNSGSAQLLHGQYQNAIDSFSQTLTVVKQHLAQKRKINPALYGVIDYDFVKPLTWPNDKEVNPIHLRMSHYLERKGHLFRCPIQIANIRLQNSADDISKQLPIILIYNLALAHHLQVIQHDCTQEVGTQLELNHFDRDLALQKTLRLYKIALRSCTEQNDSLELILILLNNIINIERELQNDHRVRTTSQKLLEVYMIFVSSSTYKRKYIDAFEQLDNAISHVIQSLLGGTVVAPAA